MTTIRIGVLYSDGSLMVMMKHGGDTAAAEREAVDLRDKENKALTEESRARVVSIDLDDADIVDIDDQVEGGE